VQQEEIKEQFTYTRKKQFAHKDSVALATHLPVGEVGIYLEGDRSEMTCIGKRSD
jgi:hypothetical protein